LIIIYNSFKSTLDFPLEASINTGGISGTCAISRIILLFRSIESALSGHGKRRGTAAGLTTNEVNQEDFLPETSVYAGKYNLQV
jgi:hypothetical protein